MAYKTLMKGVSPGVKSAGVGFLTNQPPKTTRFTAIAEQGAMLVRCNIADPKGFSIGDVCHVVSDDANYDFINHITRIGGTAPANTIYFETQAFTVNSGPGNVTQTTNPPTNLQPL